MPHNVMKTKTGKKGRKLAKYTYLAVGRSRAMSRALLKISEHITQKSAVEQAIFKFAEQFMPKSRKLA